MQLEDFLNCCLHGIGILLVSLFIYFMGYDFGVKSMEKEVIQKRFGRYDIDTTNHIVFKWNEKI
jgi:hypothetical protein